MKTVKKILCTILVAVMCLTPTPLQGFVGLEWPKWSELFSTKASALAESGQCGNNVYWTYNSSTRKLVISGTGEMYDYDYPKSPFCFSAIENVVIEDGVTSIGDNAFIYCDSLTSVTIGNSVTSIGDFAFKDCYNLTSITIPGSVTSIGEAAFSSCALTSVTIPESVSSIGLGAFFSCENLTHITVNNANKYYSSDGYGVLFNKDKTTLIQYPNGNNNTMYSIPDSVTSIGDCAFEECDRLTNITIPDNVTIIGEDAFSSCFNLTNITIPGSVTRIGEWAFSYCYSLTSVAIPESVTSIGEAVFEACSNLDVYYSGTEAQWNAINIGDNNEWLFYATIHYNSGGVSIPTTASTTYKGITATLDSAYFESNSINYNHDLARFCSLFTVIGYNDKTTIASRLEDCGFIVDGNYIVKNASQEQVNNFITHKKVIVNGKEHTLIFAAYIGSHKKQWYSNFDPGRGTTHNGFTNAKNYAYSILENYIKDLGVSKDETIILLTGHSRGAATTNLVAKQLIDNEKYATKDKIYAYAFATPNSTSLSEQKAEKYKRIFNIVNPEDLVTKMIPSAWGYGRYGVTYTLPSKTNDKKYKDYKTAMNEKYKLLMDGESYHPYPGGEKQTYNVMHDLNDSVKNINQFYDRGFCWLDTWTTVQEFMTDTLCKYQATSGDEKKEAQNLLLETYIRRIRNSVLINSLTDYFVVYQGLGAFTDGWIMDDYFAEAHQAETYCAFMMSMSEGQIKTTRKGYQGSVNCPVDVEIYDNETDELVGRIVNNAIDEEITQKENSIVMDVEGDSKTFWLPSNGDYEIKLIGNDEGTMDYTLSEIDSDVGEVARVNFFDVEITENKTMTADVEAETFAIEEHVLNYEEEVIEPSENSVEEEIEVYNITTTATTGGYVSDSQTAKSGDYVSLVAVSEEEWELVGWYENNELISTESEIAFVAKSDREFIVEFKHNHTYEEERTASTCIEDGLVVYTCSCGDTYTENIEATGHDFDGNICKNCGFNRSETCGCICHKTGFVGFIYKIVRLFWRLFKIEPVCQCGVNHY